MNRLILLFFLTFSILSVSNAQQKKWTPPPVYEIIELIKTDKAAAAKKVRSSWGKTGLTSGKLKWIEKTAVILGVTSKEAVIVMKKDGSKIGEMIQLDEDGLHVFAREMGNHQDFDYQLKTTSGKTIGGGNIKIEHYDYPPESERHDGVPQGKLLPHVWKDSKIFPGTVRDFLVYIPEQYDGSEPAALMVFQDGLRHADVNASGGLRAPTVYDNLIASGDMPVTIGIFINPGSLTTQKPGDKPRNRSFEYDSLGDSYVRFLEVEIIPFVTKEHDLNISSDPKMRAIAGGSSGCACAWTAAWERPDQFGKVLGWVGTFTDIRGAHVYPSLVRKTETKPIRAALLGENNDIDNKYGSWPLANRQMDAALKFSSYDYQYWWGNGFHGSRHAAVMLPEMLKWLWSE